MKLFPTTPHIEAAVAAARNCVEADQWAPGPATTRAAQAVSEFFGGIPALATDSATAALQIASEFLIPRDAEVLVPATTWPGTYCAIGRRLRFHDQYGYVAGTPAAAVLVELWGQTLYPWARVAQRVILDAAHALCMPHHRELFRSGVVDAIVYSVGPTKEIGTPRGGFVVSPHITDAWQTFAHYGVGPGRYPLTPRGINGIMTEFSAELFLQQWPKLDEWREHRRSLLRAYRKVLGCYCVTNADSSGHIASYCASSRASAELIKEALKKEGIEFGNHYPLPRWLNPRLFPNSTRIEHEQISLPCHLEMTPADALRVARIVDGARLRK